MVGDLFFNVENYVEKWENNGDLLWNKMWKIFWVKFGQF